MPEEERRGPSLSLFRAASIITAAAVVSRILGYVRESVLAARFGASSLTDAYLTAQDLPLTLNATLVGALVAVFIPVYREAVQRRGPEAGRRLTSSVLNVTLAVVTLLTALGLLAAPLLIELLVPGFTPDLKALTVSLVRLTLPALMILGVSGVVTALLNGNRRFTGPALVGLPQNLAIIVAVLLVSGPEDVDRAALGVVVGAFFGLLIQLPWARGLGFGYQPLLELTDPGLRRMGQMILPIMLSFGVQHVQIIVDRVLASGLVGGSIAALNFANRINSLPYGVIGVAITTVLFPTLSELAASHRMDELKATVSGGLRTLAFILVPMTVGVYLFREPLVRLIFERGAFTAGGTQMTAEALQFYALGILFFGWMDLLNRTFYALQDTRTPMIIAVASVGLNIILNLLLIGPLRHAGLALGTAIAGMAAALSLLYMLRRKVGLIGLTQVLRTVGLGLIGSLIGAGLGLLVMRTGAQYLPAGTLSQAILLATALGLVVICHGGLAVALNTPDGAEVRRRLSGLVRRGNR